MIASAITPAPMTPSVDPRSGLIVGLYEAEGSEGYIALNAAFVSATRQLRGVLGSTLYQSATDPVTLTIVERFAGRYLLEQHMAAEYFRRFQSDPGPSFGRTGRCCVL
jgi:quinol monooxygenase YgiN